MSHIKLTRAHTLSEAECCAVAEQLLDKLVDYFGGSFDNQGTQYSYKHKSGVKARVLPRAGEITVEVKLSLMTRALAPKIEQEMNRVLDEYLG